jgi:tRNA (guanine37-N1)-methyltransferase
MNFHVISLFPEVIDAYVNASVLGRAQKENKVKIKTYQLRDFAGNRWGKVDERPYGGGPGMVLRAEPIIKAVQSIRKPKAKIIITSAGGKTLTNSYARKLSKRNDAIIICGRYEGIDARVKKILRAEEISVGPYILTGGEVPALSIIDATARQIKGVLGKYGSLEEKRVASSNVYTRPEILKFKYKKYNVPKVLLSGHFANIDAWKNKKRSYLK